MSFLSSINWLYFIFQAVSFILILNETRLQSLVLKGIFPHFYQVSHGKAGQVTALSLSIWKTYTILSLGTYKKFFRDFFVFLAQVFFSPYEINNHHELKYKCN